VKSWFCNAAIEPVISSSDSERGKASARRSVQSPHRVLRRRGKPLSLKVPRFGLSGEDPTPNPRCGSRNVQFRSCSFSFPKSSGSRTPVARPRVPVFDSRTVESPAKLLSPVPGVVKERASLQSLQGSRPTLALAGDRAPKIRFSRVWRRAARTPVGHRNRSPGHHVPGPPWPACTPAPWSRAPCWSCRLAIIPPPALRIRAPRNCAASTNAQPILVTRHLRLFSPWTSRWKCIGPPPPGNSWQTGPDRQSGGCPPLPA